MSYPLGNGMKHPVLSTVMTQTILHDLQSETFMLPNTVIVNDGPVSTALSREITVRSVSDQLK